MNYQPLYFAEKLVRLEDIPANGKCLTFTSNLITMKLTVRKEGNAIQNRWDCDWNQIKNISGLIGFEVRTRVCFETSLHKNLEFNLEDELTESRKIIYLENVFPAPSKPKSFIFSFKMTPIIDRTKDYETILQSTPQSNFEVIIGGKKAYVNNEFLKHHCIKIHEFVNTTPEKLGQWKEEPITWNDFGLIMATIGNAPIFPEDRNVERLLELDQRYKIPAVFRHVEHHLQKYSSLSYDKLLDLQTKFGVDFHKPIDSPIKYRVTYTITDEDKVLGTKTKQGLQSTTSGVIRPENISFQIRFAWPTLRNVELFKATIIAKFSNETFKIEKEVFTNQEVSKVGTGNTLDCVYIIDKTSNAVKMELDCVMTPVYSSVKKTERIFRAISNNGNFKIVAEGKEILCHREILNYHSEYFRALECTPTAEGILPAHAVTHSYEEMGLLMIVIHSEVEFPTDDTVEKLAKLADDFKVACVTKQVIRHLTYKSWIVCHQKILIAHKYHLPDLLKELLPKLNKEEAGKLKAIPGFLHLPVFIKQATYKAYKETYKAIDKKSVAKTDENTLLVL